MKKGFTLIEMLSVVIILALLFLVVAPKLSSLVKDGENKNKALTEERVIGAAKEYATSYDTSFLKDFINVNDTKSISSKTLLDNGLITEDDIEILDNFTYVQVKLIEEAEEQKLEYTIIY